MSELIDKEKRAIKLLRMVANRTVGDIEICYSGELIANHCKIILKLIYNVKGEGEGKGSNIIIMMNPPMRCNPGVTKKNMTKLRVFTAFSGYDSQCMALDRIGIEYDLVGWSEIDKFAIRAHNAVFPQYADRNFGDIVRIDPNALPDFDLMTYSSPCQDFSVAGRQRGGEKGSGTRSSLLWYCEDIIRVKRPRYLVMENVKHLVSRKFLPLFMKWESKLRDLGYVNFTKVMNARDYGVPQNRERVFMISIINGFFTFPEKNVLRRRLGDVLEECVSRKYYLSPSMRDLYLSRLLNDKRYFVSEPREMSSIARCVRASSALSPTDNIIICRGHGFYKGSISPISPTLSSSTRSNTVLYKGAEFRRLTPRETFRLMGVSENDINAIQGAKISESQQYKMAGNSIVVDVLAAIFRNLFN